MIKNNIKILTLFCIFILITQLSSYAYSDDLFEFDLPDSYIKTIYGEMYMFMDANNENRGFMIYVYEDSSIKKSVWEIDDDDLDIILNRYVSKENLINVEKKAKLGNEKAIKISAGNSDGEEAYCDMYILASNNYIYTVMFAAYSQEELQNADFQKIQQSFKLKDRTTNYTAVNGLLVVGAVGFGTFMKSRKRKTRINKLHNTDYMNF